MKTPAQKRRDKKKSHIPFRLNLLFFIVFLLFSSLILRLGYLQIIRADEYQAEVERTERTTITGSVPRGEIFDANLRRLVGNEARHTITYTRGRSVPASQMAEVAYDLADYISMPSVPFYAVDSGSDLSRRDLQDFFIARNQDVIRERLTDDERTLDGTEAYQAMLDHVSDSELEDFNERDLEAAAIFKKMNAAYALSTVNVKNEDVTQEEIARISENLDSLPGVGTGTDWVRMYPEGDMLNSILGSVASEERGVPEERLRTYLARGYSRNDRVGISQIELQYESVLRGAKSRLETETNSRGDIINQIEQYSGEKGDNLILTVDIDFQEQVEQIAIDSLAQRQGLSNSIYIVAMDPSNGDVLALTGKQIRDGEVVDDALGTVNKNFSMGSSIKGATILASSMEGVLDSSNNTIVDTPIRIRGSNPIRSVFNRDGGRIPMNDITALERSSNVYMARLAMRMGGVYDYTPGEGLPMNGGEVLDTQRKYFNQFGLGVPTGIDLPSESTGYQGPGTSAGEALFFSFGQYDTYTPMQLAQYISTIANGGTRLAPRLVSEIRDTDPSNGRVGALKTEVEPKILNHVDASEEAMNRVQQGFYQAVHGSQGTARTIFAGTPYDAAGKTGTAETFYWDDDLGRNTESVTNLTFVGYAPYNEPEIAVAVVVPNLPNQNRTNQENQRAARRVLDAYFGAGEFEGSGSADEVEDIRDLEDTAEETQNEDE